MRIETAIEILKYRLEQHEQHAKREAETEERRAKAGERLIRPVLKLAKPYADALRMAIRCMEERRNQDELVERFQSIDQVYAWSLEELFKGDFRRNWDIWAALKSAETIKECNEMDKNLAEFTVFVLRCLLNYHERMMAGDQFLCVKTIEETGAAEISVHDIYKRWSDGLKEAIRCVMKVHAGEVMSFPEWEKWVGLQEEKDPTEEG